MEAASSAINKILTGSGQQEPKKDESVAPAVDDSHVGQKDTTVEQEVAPAVQHEHVKKEHETREQTVVDRERHQDHYHTTVQPLKDQEIQAEKHDHKTANTEHRDINNDAEGDKVKAKFNADQAAFKSTSEEKRSETKSKDDTVVGEHVHHHVHETIQPVIEKGMLPTPTLRTKSSPIDIFYRGDQAFRHARNEASSRENPGAKQARGHHHQCTHLSR
jgi:hypothetical protein